MKLIAFILGTIFGAMIGVAMMCMLQINREEKYLIRKVKTFLTKTYNKDNTTPYAWINTEYRKLSNQDIENLQEYINKKRIY